MPHLYTSPFDVDKRMPAMLVIVDLGNANLKFIVYFMGENGLVHQRELVMPHGFMLLSEGGWNVAVDSAKTLSRKRSKNTQVFKFRIRDEEKGERWQAYRVGQAAVYDPANAPIVGSNKYIRGGIDALLVAGLNEIFGNDLPKGHDNIVLGIGHPPTETRQISRLIEVVKGAHKMKTPEGDEKTWNVRAAIPYDENIGGLIYMLSRMNAEGQLRDEKGKFRTNPLKAGQRFIIGDFGGRLGSIGWVRYNGGTSFDPEYNTFTPIEGGIVTVRESIRTSLINTLAELRGVGHAELPDSVIDEVLKTKQIVIGGNHDKPLDVSEIVTSSLGYLQQTRTAVRLPGFGAGKVAAHIAMTGGTLVQLGEEIKEQFENKSFLPVAPYSEIVFANNRGGAVIVMSKLAEGKNLPVHFQKSMGEGYGIQS
jgi:hypothetical protein